MAYNGFAIDKYLNAAEVTRQLDELIKKPVYSVRPDKLKMYEEEYFEKKCSKSKAMITEAKKVIPGGVQHNLAFNYPFPIVIEKAEGARLYDIDGNWYYDLLQAGGPTILGSNMPEVREKVIELLNTCGPPPACFTSMNTSWQRRSRRWFPLSRSSVCWAPEPRPAWSRPESPG